MSISVSRAIKIVESLCGEYRTWNYEYAIQFVKTAEERNDWRVKKLWENENYKKLPRWAQSEIAGSIKVYDALYDRILAWTHVLDNKRVFYKHPMTDGRHIEINQQDPILSAFCYAVRITNKTDLRHRTVFVPYREADRVEDFKMGRLAESDLNVIKEPFKNGVEVQFLKLRWCSEAPTLVVDEQGFCV